AALVGGITAQGPRVGLFLSDLAASHLSDAGWPLVDAAFGWAAGMSNAPPQVIPGPDHAAVVSPASTPLDMTVIDDGRPLSLHPGVNTWSVVSCPGAVTFADVHAEHTTASFQPEAAGSTCLLRLTASDGELTGSGDVRISVFNQNQPPVVN